MKKKSKEIPEQGVKPYNKFTARVHLKPLAKYPDPPSQLYILSYIATRELEKLEKTGENKFKIFNKKK